MMPLLAKSLGFVSAEKVEQKEVGGFTGRVKIIVSAWLHKALGWHMLQKAMSVLWRVVDANW